jgi:hypothetical protein
VGKESSESSAGMKSGQGCITLLIKTPTFLIPAGSGQSVPSVRPRYKPADTIDLTYRVFADVSAKF